MTQYTVEIMIVVKPGLQSEELIHHVPLAQLRLSRARFAIHRLEAGSPWYHPPSRR